MKTKNELWELIKFIVLYLLFVVALGALLLKYFMPRAHGAVVAHARAPVQTTWDFMERRKPASLRDCPPQTKIVVNMSSSIYGPYSVICYWGTK